MRVLVTGGNGLVGKALKSIMPNAEYVSKSDYDLTNAEDVIKMYKNILPTHVIHLAARVGGIIDNTSSPASFFDENVLMNTNVVKWAKIFGVKRLIGVLSSCSYPDVVDHYPMKEDVLFSGAPPSTNFAYAIAKRAMATQIIAYNQQYGTRYCYVIPCNLYGEKEKYNEVKSHFISSLVNKVVQTRHGGIVELLGDGTPLRQHLYVNDFARVLRDMIKMDITESFNVAPEENLSIKEIACILAYEANVAITFSGDMTGQHRKDIDTTLFRSIFPDFKFTPLKEGIIKYYQHELNKANK